MWAILLAAGASQRFGTESKLLADIGGEPVRRVARVLVRTGLKDLVVVTGHEQRICQQALEGLPVQYVNNTDLQSGMGSSIATGISALDGEVDGAFIVPKREKKSRFRMSKRPNIRPKVLRDLEKFGVEPIKIKLMHQHSNEPDGVLRFDNATALHREIHDWLKWKADKQACWVRAGVVASFIAMVAAIAAAWFSYPSLPK